MIWANSSTEPGHPWVTIIGRASSWAERMCWKWTSSPSIAVMKLGRALIAASQRRQS